MNVESKLSKLKHFNISLLFFYSINGYDQHWLHTCPAPTLMWYVSSAIVRPHMQGSLATWLVLVYLIMLIDEVLLMVLSKYRKHWNTYITQHFHNSEAQLSHKEWKVEGILIKLDKDMTYLRGTMISTFIFFYFRCSVATSCETCKLVLQLMCYLNLLFQNT